MNLSLLLGFGGQPAAKFLAELVDSTGGIDQLLFARKQGVACRANVDRDLRFRALCLDHIAADTPNHRGTVLGMDSSFHFSLLRYLFALVYFIQAH